MKKSYYLAAAAAGVALTTLAVAGTSWAAGGKSLAGSHPGPSPNAQQRQAVGQAVTNNDYEAWKTALEQQVTFLRQKATDLENKITPENFQKVVQLNQLIKDGKTAEAEKLRGELGQVGWELGSQGKGSGQKMSRRLGNK